MIRWLKRLFSQEQSILLGPAGTRSGVSVSETTALNLSTIHACVKVISEQIASLPFITYRRLPDGGKSRDRTHPNFRLLRLAPNNTQSAADFWTKAIANYCLWGNFYGQITRNPDGTAASIFLLHPSQVDVKQVSDQVIYSVQTNTGKVDLRAEDVLHVANFGFGTELKGKSPITLARETIALGMACEQHGASLIGNGAMPGGIITTPGKMKDTAIKNLKESWNSVHQGAGAAGKVAVLEEGITFTPLTMSMEDLSYIGVRAFQRSELAAIYRVPLYMIGDLTKSSYSSFEQQAIDFVVQCLRPIAVKIEQEIQRKLFFEDEQEAFFSEFLFDALLRGDTATRTAALSIQFMNGALTLDEWREYENRNPITDPTKHFVPANLTSLANVEKQPADNTDNLQAALRLPLQDAVARMIRREVAAVRTAAKKPDAFSEWCAEFFPKHESLLKEALAPAITAWSLTAGKDAQEQIQNFVGNWIHTSKAEITNNDPEYVADRWETSRLESLMKEFDG